MVLRARHVASGRCVALKPDPEPIGRLPKPLCSLAAGSRSVETRPQTVVKRPRNLDLALVAGNLAAMGLPRTAGLLASVSLNWRRAPKR